MQGHSTTPAGLSEVPGHPGYWVGRRGDVWSVRKGGWLRPKRCGKYLAVELGRGRKRYVHRLVLEAFVGSCPDGMECRHLNGNRDDNRLENLCWGTRSQNHLDCERHGTGIRGERNPTRSALTKVDDVREMRRLSAGGWTVRQIADHFHRPVTTVRQIVRRRTWAHVNGGTRHDG